VGIRPPAAGRILRDHLAVRTLWRLVDAGLMLIGCAAACFAGWTLAEVLVDALLP
jgi:hypothetical protein